MFTLVAGIVFLILAIIWSHKNWANLATKLVFTGMAIWSAVIVFNLPLVIR